MKKFYMILAAFAAMTLTAQAQVWETIEIGDWENPTTYNGSYFDMAPTNFYLAHTGAQMLYTPDMLAALNDKQNVRINGMTFMFHDETYEEIARNIKIFIYETDATEFAVVDGKKQFFPLGEQVWEEDRTYDMLFFYGEDYTVPFRFNYPYTPGKSLVVTITYDAFDDDNCTMGSDYAPFYTSGMGKALTYTNNWTSFMDYTTGEDFPDATATLGCGTNVELPLTRFQFYYEDPAGTCERPECAYAITALETVTVTITNNEPDAVVYWNVVDADGLLVDSGEFTGESYSFNVTGDGSYTVHCYAHIDGWNDSPDGGVFFTILPNEEPSTAVSELVNGKTVASVRYFNVAGQEMPQADGMTIVVTTYTDGSTSTAKVMK